MTGAAARAEALELIEMARSSGAISLVSESEYPPEVLGQIAELHTGSDDSEVLSGPGWAIKVIP